VNLLEVLTVCTLLSVSCLYNQACRESVTWSKEGVIGTFSWLYTRFLLRYDTTITTYTQNKAKSVNGLQLYRRIVSKTNTDDVESFTGFIAQVIPLAHQISSDQPALKKGSLHDVLIAKTVGTEENIQDHRTDSRYNIFRAS